MTNTNYVDFLKIFLTVNSDVYVVFLRLLCTKNDVKRSMLVTYFVNFR